MWEENQGRGEVLQGGQTFRREGNDSRQYRVWGYTELCEELFWIKHENNKI